MLSHSASCGIMSLRSAALAVTLLLAVACQTSGENPLLDRPTDNPFLQSEEAQQMLFAIRQGGTQSNEALLPVYEGPREAVQRKDGGGVLGYWVDLVGDDAPVILYFHGGAYFMLDALSILGNETPPAKAAGFNMFSVEYRRPPEASFAEMVDDFLEAYEYLLNDRGIAPERIVVMGCSAGGASVALFLNAIQGPGREHPLSPNNMWPVAPKKLPNPRAGVLGSPWVDLATRHWSTRTSFNDMFAPGSTDAVEKVIVPMMLRGESTESYNLINMNMEGWPELLIHVGSVEALLDSVLLFADRAEKTPGLKVRTKVFAGVPHCGACLAVMDRELRMPLCEQYFVDIGNMFAKFNDQALMEDSKAEL